MGSSLLTAEQKCGDVYIHSSDESSASSDTVFGWQHLCTLNIFEHVWALGHHSVGSPARTRLSLAYSILVAFTWGLVAFLKL